MNRLLIVLLTLSISTPMLAAEGFSSLEEQMTGKEFTGAGLDKLSQQELDALNAWIRAHSLATLDGPAPAGAAAAVDAEGGDQRGFEMQRGDERTTITSRIVGSFSGWDGQTVFRLENGMIWAQDDRDKFYIKAVENPVVHIEPGMFSSWHLKVEGYGSDCKVKRIQ